MAFDETSELHIALARERELFQRLEELRVMAAQMRMILAHDIKTPLAVMTGVADLLSKAPGRLTEERSTKLLTALLSSVKQIQGMVATGEAEGWAALLKPVIVDLAATARRISDVQVEGAGEVSSHHPIIVEALLQHVVGPAKRLQLSTDGDWVVLSVSGAETADPTITEHLLEMLGGKREGAQLRLPRQLSAT